MDKPVVTQAMIAAYDEFTHTSFDRRAFMSRLTALTGSAAAAAAVLPLLSAGQAAAQTIAADDPRLNAQRIEYYGEPQTQLLKGYLARPKVAKGRLPGVLVFHENRGLTAHIRDVSRRLALEGFAVLAPDFLSREGGTPANEDEARKMIGALDKGKIGLDAYASLKYFSRLEDTNGRVGAVGFCWGGGLVNRFATETDELDAGVAYYGGQPPVEEVKFIQAAMLLHYGGLDERINAGMEAYRTELTLQNKVFEMYVYEGVNHAFNNDTSPARYNKVAADLAWQRTVSFLKKYLA